MTCNYTPFLEESTKSGVVPVTVKKLSPGGKVNSKIIEQFLWCSHNLNPHLADPRVNATLEEKNEKQRKYAQDLD